MFGRRGLVIAVGAGLLVAACGSDEEGASVSFASPEEGATLAGAVSVSMVADGVTIEEAGEAHDGAGHFHVIADSGCTAKGESIEKDADHVHLGKGQSEGTIYLEPGAHELCLEVGDGVHSAAGISAKRRVEVAVTDQEEWCMVVEEVDNLFETVDGSSDDFPIKQIGYENIRRLTVQLDDALDMIDATPDDGVDEAIAFARSIATAFVDADDIDAAEQALTPIFEELGFEENVPGSAWIKSACRVDING